MHGYPIRVHPSKPGKWRLIVTQMHEMSSLKIKAGEEANPQVKYVWSSPQVKYNFYRNFFNTHFNLPFGLPKTNTCAKCDELNVLILDTTDQTKKQQLQDVWAFEYGSRILLRIMYLCKAGEGGYKYSLPEFWLWAEHTFAAHIYLQVLFTTTLGVRFWYTWLCNWQCIYVCLARVCGSNKVVSC